MEFSVNDSAYKDLGPEFLAEFQVAVQAECYNSHISVRLKYEVMSDKDAIYVRASELHRRIGVSATIPATDIVEGSDVMAARGAYLGEKLAEEINGYDKRLFQGKKVVVSVSSEFIGADDDQQERVEQLMFETPTGRLRGLSREDAAIYRGFLHPMYELEVIWGMGKPPPLPVKPTFDHYANDPNFGLF